MTIGPDKPPTMQDIVKTHQRKTNDAFEALLNACDGQWTTESPLEIAQIACNTLNRRKDAIRELESAHTKEVMLHAVTKFELKQAVDLIRRIQACGELPSSMDRAHNTPMDT